MAGLLDREAQSMGDPARLNLVVAHQTRENRQTGGIGGCPIQGPQSIARQIEHRSRAALPTPVRLRMRVPSLVQLLGIAVDDEHVTIPSRSRTSFDGCVRRKGIW